MSEPMVVFHGDFEDEYLPWESLAVHLGWRIRQTKTLDDLQEVRDLGEIPAVFLDCRADSCVAGRLAAIKRYVPNTRVVVCYPISAPVLADELVAAGAFHSVPKPLQASDVKQSLGFVWEAWSRCSKKVESIDRAAAAAA
jgi:DNA-binding NtrC family response regulator